MSGAAAWQGLSPRAQHAILLTSIVPPLVVVFVFTPIYLLYAGNPTEPNLALLVAATVAVCGVGTGLALRTWRILRHEPSRPKREMVHPAPVVKYVVALLVFGAIYLSAIYAVVFGLQPLDESSEAGAIAATLILLAVMFGLPILFYYVLRRLGVRDSWIG